MQTQMTLKQKTCSNKSVTRTKCCQTQKLVVVTTDSVRPAFLVPDQAVAQTHLVAAAVSVTSLKRFLAVVAVAIKQDLLAVKT
jgi:hypothetical protein